jgi:hypothetical protein
MNWERTVLSTEDRKLSFQPKDRIRVSPKIEFVFSQLKIENCLKYTCLYYNYEIIITTRVENPT